MNVEQRPTSGDESDVIEGQVVVRPDAVEKGDGENGGVGGASVDRRLSIGRRRGYVGVTPDGRSLRVTALGRTFVDGKPVDEPQRVLDVVKRANSGLSQDLANTSQSATSFDRLQRAIALAEEIDPEFMSRASRAENPVMEVLRVAEGVVLAVAVAEKKYEIERTETSRQDATQKAWNAIALYLEEGPERTWYGRDTTPLEIKQAAQKIMDQLASVAALSLAASLPRDMAQLGAENMKLATEVWVKSEYERLMAKKRAEADGKRALDVVDDERAKAAITREGMKEAARIGRVRQEAAARTDGIAEFWGRLADSAEKRTGRIAGNAVDGVVGEEGVVVKVVQVWGYVGDWLRDNPVVVGLSGGALAGLSGSAATALALASTVEASVLPAWAAPVAGTFIVVATVAGAAGGAWLAGQLGKYWQMGRVDEMVDAKMAKVSEGVMGEEKPQSNAQAGDRQQQGYGGVYPGGQWSGGGEPELVEEEDLYGGEEELPFGSAESGNNGRESAKELMARLLGRRGK